VKILGATVTYNRMALLERCIEHLRGQSRPPDAILVVNNSSPDGTVAMLERLGVDYVTQPNIGSAGGWRRCVTEAVERGYDAVWLMDDDGYPARDALALLEGRMGEGVCCVSSVVLCEDDRNRFVFPFPALDRQGMPRLFSRKRKYRHLDELKKASGGEPYPFAHLFNGALIGTDTIRRLGNVDSDFFLMGDEVDFLLRMMRDGRVLTHLDAHHLHPDVGGRPLDKAKFYYYVKNSIILNRRYLNKPALRSLLALAAALGRTARRNSVGEALSYVAGNRAPILWKAVARGLRGKPGKDFDG